MGDERAVSADLGVAELEARHAGEIELRQRREDRRRPRPLQRQQSKLVAAIDDLGTGGVLAHPGEVLVGIRGVDTDEDAFGVDAVHDDVIDDAATGATQQRVLRLPIAQPVHIVDGEALHRGESARSADFDLSHVADVEEPGVRAHGRVLIENGGVLNRHLPAAEIDEAGAECTMTGMERGLFHDA